MSVLSLMVFTGRWSVTGFYGVDERVILRAVGWGRMGRTLITFNSFSGPFCPRMESLWRSWTISEKNKRPIKVSGIDGKRRCSVPINPLNLLNVLGMRTCGLTSIRTPLAVWM